MINFLEWVMTLSLWNFIRLLIVFVVTVLVPLAMLFECIYTSIHIRETRRDERYLAEKTK